MTDGHGDGGPRRRLILMVRQLGSCSVGGGLCSRSSPSSAKTTYSRFGLVKYNNQPNCAYETKFPLHLTPGPVFSAPRRRAARPACRDTCGRKIAREKFGRIKVRRSRRSNGLLRPPKCLGQDGGS